MIYWNVDNKVELKHTDTGVKNKLRQLQFDPLIELENTLHAYEILNSQQTRGLTIRKILGTKIQILQHQIMAAEKVKNYFNGRVILADEVGLGKTIEAGILLKEYSVTKMIKNALVLVPPSLIHQWQQELLNKFDMSFVTNKDDSTFEGYDKHNFLIASLPSAVQPLNAEKLNSIEWDIVVVDEAHRLKNSHTKAHQFVKELQKNFILLLSATPIQNNLQELYNMIEIIKPGHLNSWKQFSSTYTVDEKSRTINPVYRNELQDLLKQVVIRTTRDEVRQYLKFTDRIPHMHLLNSSEQESELYQQATEFVRTLWSIEKGGKNFMLPLMTLQRQISSSTTATRSALRNKIKQYSEHKDKLESLIILSEKIQKDSKMKKLEEIISKDPNGKYLIFTEFVDTQDYIYDNLDDNGISAVKFNGRMSTSERDTSVTKFRNEIPILISTEAGGEGQNFQFCNNVINYDLPWNPMRVEQRVGRVHRIGQEEDVQIHNMAITNTIEEYILALLFEKINLFKMTIGDLDLLFEDEGLNRMPTQIFDAYMSSKTQKDVINKFSALGDRLVDQKSLHDTIMKFDDQVFTNFDLSVLSN